MPVRTLPLSSIVVDSASHHQQEAITNSCSTLDKGFVLENLPLTIGRSPEADIRLDDRWVSRRNTEIAEIEGTEVVREFGSTNGTLLNCEPVAEAPIFPFDRLTVGMTTLALASNGRTLVSLESNDVGATPTLGLTATRASMAETKGRPKPR